MPSEAVTVPAAPKPPPGEQKGVLNRRGQEHGILSSPLGQTEG